MKKQKRHLYGYFRKEALALEHLKKMKKCDRGTNKSFKYFVEERDRQKAGRKSWIAYRLEQRSQA